MAIEQRYGYLLRALLLRPFTFMLLAGCLSPVDLRVKNTGGIVVIAGQVSSLPEQNAVQLGTTTDAARLPLPYSDAQVWIVDETTGEQVTCIEDPVAPGTYRPLDYAGIPGHTYHVVAELPGRGRYMSDNETMPASPGTLTTRYEIRRQAFTDLDGIVSEQPFLFAYADVTLPESGDPPYVKWSIDEAFLLSPTDFPDPFGSIPPPCYVVQNADPQRIVLFNGSQIHTRSFTELLVGERIIDWTFLEKHLFTVYQSALTEAAHEYWRKVNILSNQTGSIFDAPPARLEGNIHATDSEETVLGYFQATAQTYSRFAVYRYELPFDLTVTDCVYSGTRTTYPPRCLDCTTIRNSSFNRPDWF